MSGVGDGCAEAATGPDDGFDHGMPVVQLPALRHAEVETYVHAGIAPATKCVCRADLDHFKGMPCLEPSTAQLKASSVIIFETNASQTNDRRGLRSPGSTCSTPRKPGVTPYKG
jgi:hypothetical protein